MSGPFRFRLLVEYNGTAYSGWQRQGHSPSVQQELEEALTKVLKHPVTVYGASRTDAGVHALGQAVLVETSVPIHAAGIMRATNQNLPDDISIRDADVPPDNWHPRFSATTKHYRYWLLARKERCAMYSDRAWHVPFAFDLNFMRDEAQLFLGEHDFGAFRSTQCESDSTSRKIRSIGVTELPDDIVQIDIRGNAFLRNMVRIMVGTLVYRAAGRRHVAPIPDLLARLNRTHAGITAPAKGLTLMSVEYDGTRVPLPPKPSVIRSFTR